MLGGGNTPLLFDNSKVVEILNRPMEKSDTDIQIQKQISFQSSASEDRITGLRMENYTTQQQKQQEQEQQQRYAIAIYVETRPHLYGLYSIIQQVHKLGMITQGIDIVVFATKSWIIPTKGEALLDHPDGNIVTTWLQEGLIQNLIFQDRKYIIQKVKGTTGLWPGVFNKLVFFNLTEYDKVIGLDADILIRKNIYHWFTDFATPCAIQPKDRFEWNSGAMIIEPSSEVFHALINKLSDVRANDRTKTPNITELDEWNNGFGHQGFLSSYFTVSDDPKHRMKTMGKENAILSTELTARKNTMAYFWIRRNHIFQTIHLTVHKPWEIKPQKKGTDWSSTILCEIFEEFHSSIYGMEKYNLTISTPYLKYCYDDITNAKIAAAATAKRQAKIQQKKKEK